MLQVTRFRSTAITFTYDGNAQLAQVRRNGRHEAPSSTLYTDSLNYDRLYNIGYFFEGGRLVDGDNTLTSEWGEYDLNTKKSFFNSACASTIRSSC